MRALLSVASLAPSYGGPARTVARLADGLADLDLDVALWAPDGSAATTPFLRVASQVQRYPQAPPPVQASDQPDIVFDSGLWLPYNHRLARLARQCAVPRIVSTRGMLEPWALRHRWAKKRIAWYVYQRRDLQAARAIHVTSEQEAEGVRQAGLTAPVAIVPHGVDIPEALPTGERPAIRRALFLSRIHPVKGLPLLVDAWARVRPAGWELVLAGPDEEGHRADMQRQIDAAGLTNTIQFVGSVSDDAKWPLLASADLFVLPSHSENFGLVVAEALGAGVPVLTTTGTPWREIEHHASGWRVAPDVDALAGALANATACDRPTLEEMGKRGRALVLDRYSWYDAAHKMTAVFAWALGMGDRPPTLHFD